MYTSLDNNNAKYSDIFMGPFDIPADQTVTFHLLRLVQDDTNIAAGLSENYFDKFPTSYDMINSEIGIADPIALSILAYNFTSYTTTVFQKVVSIETNIECSC